MTRLGLFGQRATSFTSELLFPLTCSLLTFSEVCLHVVPEDMHKKAVEKNTEEEVENNRKNPHVLVGTRREEACVALPFSKHVFDI